MEKYAIRPALTPDVDAALGENPQSELLRKLLVARGIETPEAAQNFLNPSYESLHDPFLMKDMDKVVDRILHAVKHNEPAIIYSDYDADGIPGAVTLHDFFKKIGYTNFKNYIPHRTDEGFGLNHEAVEQFGKEGAKLLITIDCGIADIGEVAAAMKLGIDVIITDHHEPQMTGTGKEKLPKAYAILDSKQKDCDYPYDMLCGSGVVFKLIQAIIKKLPEERRNGFKDGHEKWLLDMVGLATLSDMVPLVGENRTLAYYGLKVLRKSPRAGLMQLLKKLKINQSYVTEDDLAFMITPRINAASRMGIPMEAFRLLSTEDEVLAGELADYLHAINDERKGIVAAMVKEIKTHIASRGDMREVLVIGNPNWRPALLGLAATSLVEEHSRPVFLWGREDESTLKGSCRGDGSVSVLSLMEGARDQFIQFGGHHGSGGFSVSHENIHKLEDALVASYIALKSDPKPTEKIMIDAELSLDEVNPRTWSAIEKLAPFGFGNPKPLFIFKDAVIQEAKQFGKRPEHLELTFQNSQGRKVKAISFFTKLEDYAELGAPLAPGMPVNLIATMEKSMFRNFPEYRLRIVDIVL